MSSAKYRLLCRCIVAALLKYEYSSNKCLLRKLPDKRVVLPSSTVSNDDFIDDSIIANEYAPCGSCAWNKLIKTVYRLRRGGKVISQQSCFALAELQNVSPGRAPCSAILDAFFAIISTEEHKYFSRAFVYYIHNQKHARTVKQNWTKIFDKEQTIIILL